MISNHVIFCRDCMDKIGGFGSHCTELIEHACINHFFKYPLLIDQKTTLSECIRFLELKSYIITTEFDQHDLWIVPNTKTFTKNQRVYCWCQKRL